MAGIFLSMLWCGVVCGAELLPVCSDALVESLRAVMSVKVVTGISWAEYCDKWMHYVAALSLGGPGSLSLSPPTSDNRPRQMRSWWPKKTPPRVQMLSLITKRTLIISSLFFLQFL